MSDWIENVEQWIEHKVHPINITYNTSIITPVIGPLPPPPRIVQHWPHDDTESMINFYGKPWEDHSLLVGVPVPFSMTFREENGHLTPITHIVFNKKGAEALSNVLNKIAELSKTDSSVLKHVQHFSGSYNYRNIRGSSRLSEHAFGAALDFDAENQPMTYEHCYEKDQPQSVYDAFITEGFFWGGNYKGRKDPMHYGLAHE